MGGVCQEQLSLHEPTDFEVIKASNIVNVVLSQFYRHYSWTDPLNFTLLL